MLNIEETLSVTLFPMFFAAVIACFLFVKIMAVADPIIIPKVMLFKKSKLFIFYTSNHGIGIICFIRNFILIMK